MISPELVLLIAALVCLLAAAVGVTLDRLQLGWLGLALVVLAWLVR